MKIALGVQYDGTHYHGWQAQKELSTTIQAHLEKALSKVANHTIKVVCAGRTDARVHAVEQVVHFETTAIRSNRSWVMGANRYLPKDITVYWATKVVETFHARFSASARYYRYVLCEHPIRLTLHRDRVGWYYHALDFSRMSDAAQFLLGEHDFQLFRSTNCQAKTSIRKVSHISLLKKDSFIIIDIKANAFLHNMVRNIVAALVDIGKEKQDSTWIKSLLSYPEKALENGLSTAPPQGLYLMRVFYPEKFQLPQKIFANDWMMNPLT